MTPHVTRLAPSPTGALHLGNARTFLLNFLLSRQRGWRMLLRVEDLDGPRVKAAATGEMLQILRWLGFEWEEPIVYQSQRAPVYRAAMEQLIAAGAAYPCTCSRKDAELAGGAPHADDPVSTYPGTCRGRWKTVDDIPEASRRVVSWRVRVPAEPIVFDDAFAGPQGFDLERTCGDFVVFRGAGTAAYQLAVVLDDAAAGVDQVVRGDDLLESGARQIHLRRLLGLSPKPTYWHVPLVVGPDGRRLAKRHGDTRLSHYRRRGVTAQRILGLLGYWSGLLERRRETEADDLLARFDPACVPSERVVFTPDDDAFLLGR